MTAPAPSSAPATREPIGFIGLGQMGLPMVKRLASLGYDAVVYARKQAVVSEAVAAGARAVKTVKEVADAAKVVCICLPSLESARDVIFGAGGLVEGKAIETLVDFSTTGSEFALDVGARLAERKIMLIDAPITGSVATAAAGKLGVMCSGPERGFRQAEPYLLAMASAIVLYLGEANGRAQRLKLLNNLQSATGMAASCEALVIGVKWGLAPEIMLEVINAGDASTNASRNKIAKCVFPRQFDYGAHMSITSKDTTLTVSEAEDLGVPMWIGQAVRQLWKYAVTQGGAERDGTALITYLEPWAGIEVRAGVNAMKPADGTTRRATRTTVVCDERVADALSERLAGESNCTLVPLPHAAGGATLLQAIGGAEGRTIINLAVMSTADSVALAHALDARGETYVDAALTGTERDLAAGRGNVLASANHAVFASIQPLLARLGARVFHVADKPGGAHLMRQIDGFLCDAILGAACECYVAGAKDGMDPLVMVKIFGVETGRTTASARLFPEQIATRKFDSGKRIGDANRELALLSTEAARLGITPWVLGKTELLYRLAAQLGTPADDITRLAAHYEKWVGAEVRAGLGAP